MEEYEVISDNIKIKWLEDFDIEDKRYTQVSAYIYNDKNELLIVEDENEWKIPGGHPEKGETKEETLRREVMEEAYVTIKELKYIGAVEVIENDEKYYQLRYKAKLDEILPFKKDWETIDRKFVRLEDLNKYITYSNGRTFTEQLNSSIKKEN